MRKFSGVAWGILMIVVSLFSAITLVSFSPADPSFDHAVDVGQISNWGGRFGAYIASPLLGVFGAAIMLPVGFLLFNGMALIKRGQNLSTHMIRLSVMFITMPFLALSFHLLGDVVGLKKKLGGVLGEFIYWEYGSMVAVKMVAIAAAMVGIIISWNITFSVLRRTVRICMLCLFYLWRSLRIVYKLMAALVRFVKGCIPGHKENENAPYGDVSPAITAPEITISVNNKIENKPSVQKKLRLEPEEFELPSTMLLKEVIERGKKSHISEAALSQNSKLLKKVLEDFGILGDIIKIHPGPVVTLYEFEPTAGTKSSRVIGLADDIARSMSAISARIAIMPGKIALGIELPNTHREMVALRELLESRAYRDTDCKLPLVLGKNIGGEPIIADLAKMPHLLVAGTTGSGKSVAINTMILSLLYAHPPSECRFIMIDPKMLELSVYDGIPHLLAPVVTEPKKAVAALKWVVKEMENRYRLMSTIGVRNLEGYNKVISDAIRNNQPIEKKVQIGFDSETGQPSYETITIASKHMPCIVVIVDEMADLMIVAGKEIENSIQRLAQMARAAGIHIIMATQRPSVDVITGIIKANFPTRISFQVTSKIDSRTILGEQGAEQLLGMGDMLFMRGGGRIERVHGPFVSDMEVEKVTQFLKTQGQPEYIGDITIDDEERDADANVLSSEDDGLFQEAVAIVLRDRKASTSYIQRCLRIGYNRAAILMEQMEKQGIVSPPNHTGKREILKDA